ncbi:hypothetical protein JTB14_032791 [Gonioctena quinquepunctata]|nr:hypothetical protein JTB14_032791 [Gonioctena quinquepunctata]
MFRYNGLVKYINTKEDLLKKYKTKSEQFEKEYTNYRKFLNRFIQETERNYYIKEIEGSKNSPKTFWNTIKSLSKSEKSRDDIEELLSDKHKLIKDNQQEAEFLNNYFADIGMKLAEQIEIPNRPHPKRKRHTKYFFLRLTTPAEVRSAVETPRYDGFRAETLK